MIQPDSKSTTSSTGWQLQTQLQTLKHDFKHNFKSTGKRSNQTQIDPSRSSAGKKRSKKLSNRSNKSKNIFNRSKDRSNRIKRSKNRSNRSRPLAVDPGRSYRISITEKNTGRGVGLSLKIQAESIASKNFESIINKIQRRYQSFRSRSNKSKAEDQDVGRTSRSSGLIYYTRSNSIKTQLKIKIKLNCYQAIYPLPRWG